MRRGTRRLLAAFLLAGCVPAPAGPSPASGATWLDRLYLGRNVEGRPGVSDEAWERFLHEAVVPRFPDGFTVLHAEGRWRGRDTTEAERSFVLEVVHAGDTAADRRVREIAREYRERFRQEAVLRVRLRAEAALLRRDLERE